jgi:hypothetical protein
MTAAGTSRLAPGTPRCRARLLVLTHFAQRHGSGDAQRLAGEAAIASGGQVVLAHDMTGAPFRPGSRQRPANSRPAGTSSADPGHPGPGGTTPPTATECPICAARTGRDDLGKAAHIGGNGGG